MTTFQTNVSTTAGSFSPATSYQYQDVGIKVAIEPRVHHNREVTLKLTVEVSDIGPKTDVGGGLSVPSFNTRTIEDTIRLKDGETNFLAGLIQSNETSGDSKTPFLGDIPILGRLFTQNTQHHGRTDLMLTMTPHIIRVPDITDDDLAPMWVGTQNNLTFRGVSPRIESRAGTDPFTPIPEQYRNTPTLGGEPGNYIQTPPEQTNAPAAPRSGAPPNDPFGKPAQTPPPPPNPEPQSQLKSSTPSTSSTTSTTFASTGGSPAVTSLSTPATLVATASDAVAPSLAVAGRISPQPVHLAIQPGEMKTWSVVGMDLDGLTTNEILLHFDPRTLAVVDVGFGNALVIDPRSPPIASIDTGKGLVRISSSNAHPLAFNSGGEIAILHVQGGLAGDTFLVVDIPEMRNVRGDVVNALVVGGKAKVE